jgi:hypothetical protein
MRGTFLALLTWFAVLPFVGGVPKAEAKVPIEYVSLYSFHTLWPDTGSSWAFEGQEIAAPNRAFIIHQNLGTGKAWVDGEYAPISGTWSIKIKVSGHNINNPNANIVNQTTAATLKTDGTWFVEYPIGFWSPGCVYTFECVESTRDTGNGPIPYPHFDSFKMYTTGAAY